MKILIVDDDPEFRHFMVKGLNDSGIEALAAADAGSARLLVDREEATPFDLILLDVMMPGESGWDFLEHIRREGNETQVIFVSARHEVSERVKGLRLGADDYIVKPFDFSGFLARIDAVHRRKSTNLLNVCGIEIDCERRQVRVGERQVELTQREYEVLLALCRAKGKVLSREEILHKVWGIDFDPETNVVTVAVARLRAKLDERGRAPSRIRTVVGEGYMLTERAQ